MRVVMPSGVVVTEHEIEVPLDHARSDGARVPLFARELAAPDGADRPYLVYLQGGPGGESPRPTFGRAPGSTSPAWIDRALRHFRVLLLDDRGTGRSAPLGGLAAMTPADQAEHLSHFRADAIVADCEALRAHLGVERWSLLGQSFGGFCTFSYLSVAPHALASAYVTGGVPPVGRGPAEVYASTYPSMERRSHAFYERYPADRDRMLRLLDLAADDALLLPDGSSVTPTRLRSVGTVLGMSYGAETLHHLLERQPTSPEFRHALQEASAFSGSAPLYALLQEACCADGGVTDWAASRCLPPSYDDPTLFFGEHAFPSTFADTATLAPYAEAAELLAQREWPRLYDETVLAGNDVPVACAVYAGDPYVDQVLSAETVARVPHVSAWVTDEHDHDGLRTSGAEVLDRLFAMVPPPG